MLRVDAVAGGAVELEPVEFRADAPRAPGGTGGGGRLVGGRGRAPGGGGNGKGSGAEPVTEEPTTGAAGAGAPPMRGRDVSDTGSDEGGELPSCERAARPA